MSVNYYVNYFIKYRLQCVINFISHRLLWDKRGTGNNDFSSCFEQKVDKHFHARSSRIMNSKQENTMFSFSPNRTLNTQIQESSEKYLVAQNDQLKELGNNSNLLSSINHLKPDEMFDEETSCFTNPQDNDQANENQKLQFSKIFLEQQSGNLEPEEASRNKKELQGQHSTKRVVKPPRCKVLGDMSYSDIIAMAIESSEDKKMTLSQIYQWISLNIPYFKSKSECSSSNAGWKNAVRHTLSIRKRFIRLSNESSGNNSYSSFWTINPRTRNWKSRNVDPLSPETPDIIRVKTVSRSTQTQEESSMYVPRQNQCNCCFNGRGDSMMLIAHARTYWTPN